MACPGHSPHGRIEAGNATEVAGPPNAAPKVAAQAQWRPTRSDDGHLAAAATARGAGEVIRVTRPAIDLIVGLTAPTQLRTVRFPQQDSACGAHACYGRRVLCRHERGKSGRPGCGDHTSSGQRILYRHRHTM